MVTAAKHTVQRMRFHFGGGSRLGKGLLAGCSAGVVGGLAVAVLGVGCVAGVVGGFAVRLVDAYLVALTAPLEFKMQKVVAVFVAACIAVEGMTTVRA
jgi:hypothetical protein